MIIIMVPDTPNVASALFDPNGIAAGLIPGKIVVDMSSISPIETKEFAKKINGLGCEYLDAPVSGGEVGARNATLSIMVGGRQETFDKVKPLFDLMGKNIILVGGIGEMNTVRRHLSAIKGGRLAAACHPARVVTLLISDVPGDDPVNIASGPTVADPTTCADALALIRRYGMKLPASAIDALESGRGESVKPGDPRLSSNEVHLLTTPQAALEAAAEAARAAGVTPYILGDAIEGEARDVGKVMAGIARQVATRQQPIEKTIS